MWRPMVMGLVAALALAGCAGGDGIDGDAAVDAAEDSDVTRPGDAEPADVIEPPDGEPLEDAGPDGDAGDPHEPAVRWHELSPSRAGPYVVLSDDGHEFERVAISSEAAGSAHGVKASDGVFYFEMSALVDDPRQSFGVGPADMELEGDVGDHPQSLGVSELGFVLVDGQVVDDFSPGPDVFGFVVDRRGEAPTVHIITWTPAAPEGAVVSSYELAGFEGPIHAYVSGPRLALGPQARFNAGYDTVNAPFTYDARAALAEVDPEAAERLVLGFGSSESGPWNEPPVITLSGPSSVEPGAAAPLFVAAHDAEDGALHDVVLEDDALPHSARAIVLEGGTVYRTTVVGRHRLRARVVDSGGKVAEAVHVLDVSGTPAVGEPVRLVTRSGDGATISEGGRGVRFTQVTKDGVRANQGLLDGYWYFEATRVAPPGNFGAGLVVQEGSIAPYALRAVPASMSMNFISGIWHDIIWQASQPEGGPHLTVGFAVDYRRDLPAGRDYPIVHVIVAGVLAASVHVTDATTPVHPMLYGTIGPGAGAQLVANFGESPFLYDARAILADAGHEDADQLARGWGVHAASE